MSVVAIGIREKVKELKLANVPPGPSGRYKVRISQARAETLFRNLGSVGKIVAVPLDFPSKKVHPDWLEADERFVCFLDDAFVVRVVR